LPYTINAATVQRCRPVRLWRSRPPASPRRGRVICEARGIWSHYPVLDVRKASRASHPGPGNWLGLSLYYQIHATMQLCRTDCPVSPQPPPRPGERLIPDPRPLAPVTVRLCNLSDLAASGGTERPGSGLPCISIRGEPRSRSSSATCTARSLHPLLRIICETCSRVHECRLPLTAYASRGFLRFFLPPRSGIRAGCGPSRCDRRAALSLIFRFTSPYLPNRPPLRGILHPPFLSDQALSGTGT
jgi:hypothetical protein